MNHDDDYWEELKHPRITKSCPDPLLVLKPEQRRSVTDREFASRITDVCRDYLGVDEGGGTFIASEYISVYPNEVEFHAIVDCLLLPALKRLKKLQRKTPFNAVGLTFHPSKLELLIAIAVYDQS
jgi:hypothetical protein